VNNIGKRIASTLKLLRKTKGWSLDKAAQETGVSKAMLGQIERGESSPTIATLWKIATGFETSFSSFIEEPHADFEESMHRSGETKQLHPNDEKIRVMPLFPFDQQLALEIFVIELLPSCEHLSPPHKEGVVEHIIVAEGKMEVLVNNTWKPLTKGEGLRFNANQPHGYRNKSSKKSCFHNIIHYPTHSR
jgi:transcriptional regulator with XRE-family HTH domain